MRKKKSNKISEKSASAYKHDQEATQRPGVVVPLEFDAQKEPRTYRYDSTLAIELNREEYSERNDAHATLGIAAA